MTTAIEELEKLAEELPSGSYTNNNLVYRDDVAREIDAILPRLRAEVRDGKRAAFVAGRVWANEWFAMPTADWQESTEAEALRRYKEV